MKKLLNLFLVTAVLCVMATSARANLMSFTYQGKIVPNAFAIGNSVTPQFAVGDVFAATITYDGSVLKSIDYTITNASGAQYSYNRTDFTGYSTSVTATPTTFRAQAIKTSPFFDIFSMSIGTGAAYDVTHNFKNGSSDGYNVNVLTPEPATMAILGLGAMGLIRRKRAA